MSDVRAGFARGLGRALKLARAVRNLSRAELAEASGLSYSYLAEIENGKKQPSSRATHQIAGALDLSVAELMEGAEYWTREGAPEDEVSSPDQRMLQGLLRPEQAPSPQAPGHRGARSRQWSWFRSVGSTPEGSLAEVASDSRQSDAGNLRGELLDLFNRLGPEDRERVLDLARRLAE